jgi:hypothetical protein
MMAASNGSVACLRALRAGAYFTSVNAVAECGNSALDLALKFEQYEAANFLRDEMGAVSANDANTCCCVLQ